MRTITKLPEPSSLARYRASSSADFDGYPKAELQTQLVLEQHGICCYCGGRIRAEWNGIKIEHWKSKTRYPALQLDYTNLLGACFGNEGTPPNQHHCDTKKGDADISRNPAAPLHRVEDFIHYLSDGSVDSNDGAFKTDLNRILNLNLEYLKNNRKAVLEAFKDALIKRELPTSYWARELAKWDGTRSGPLPAYAPIVAYWIRKRLAR